MRLARFAAVLILLLFSLFPVTPAHAATITVSEVHVYENIFEADDAVLVIYYQLGTWTTELGVARLIEDDGTTIVSDGVRSFEGELGDYYLTGFIFDATYDFDTGDGANGWGDALTVRLSGNPTQFPTVPTDDCVLTVDCVIQGGDWHTSTSTTEGRSQLQDRLVSLLNQIETADPAIANNDLVISTSTGWRATDAGATVVLTALPGLYSPLPTLFATQSSTATFDQTTPGTGLQDDIDTATNSDSFKPAAQGLGSAFGFGNAFASMLGLAAVVAVFVLARKQEVPAMASLGLAVPMALFAARAGIMPLGWIALAAFMAWFVGLWRSLRPSGEVMVMFVAFMYLLGIIMGAMIDGSNIGSGSLDVINSMFNLRIFSQQDSSILGTIFSVVSIPFELALGLVRMAFWNFAFWNDLGMIKWLVWFPTAFAFYFKLYTAIFGR